MKIIVFKIKCLFILFLILNVLILLKMNYLYDLIKISKIVKIYDMKEEKNLYEKLMLEDSLIKIYSELYDLLHN